MCAVLYFLRCAVLSTHVFVSVHSVGALFCRLHLLCVRALTLPSCQRAPNVCEHSSLLDGLFDLMLCVILRFGLSQV